MLQNLTHARLVKDARRPPGMIADHPCQGMVVAQSGAIFRDATQPREGGVNDEIEVTILACRDCGHCLPVAHGPGEVMYLRNDHDPAASVWAAPQPLSRDRSRRS